MNRGNHIHRDKPLLAPLSSNVSSDVALLHAQEALDYIRLAFSSSISSFHAKSLSARSRFVVMDYPYLVSHPYDRGVTHTVARRLKKRKSLEDMKYDYSVSDSNEIPALKRVCVILVPVPLTFLLHK